MLKMHAYKSVYDKSNKHVYVSFEIHNRDEAAEFDRIRDVFVDDAIEAMNDRDLVTVAEITSMINDADNVIDGFLMMIEEGEDDESDSCRD